MNSNGNGPGGIQPGVHEQGIPIIGQPFELKNWFLTTLLQCNCEAKAPVLLVGAIGAKAACPACKKIFVLQGFSGEPPAKLTINIGLALPVADAVAAP